MTRDINISALASTFQSLFKEKIIPDRKRLAFWIEHRDKITQPIYVTAMVKVMQELVKDKNFSDLEQWIKFCEWVLKHSNSKQVEDQTELLDKQDYLDWENSRQAVVDFIDECVNKDTNAPVTARKGLAGLLQQVCSQSDLRLDHDRRVLLNKDDPVTEAINSIRSKALKSLIHFGFWIRRYCPNDNVPELTDILSERIAEDTDFLLTRPEHALLGIYFGDICTFNRNWAIKQQKIFFPQENALLWRDAFGSYVRFNVPSSKETFEVLRAEFEYAIDNLDILAAIESHGREIVDRLCQYFLIYYLRGFYPLTGNKSLLNRFYDQTNSNPKLWAQLFDHAGRFLSNGSNPPDKAITDRAIDYFDWRFRAAEPLELQEFTFWLKAERFTPKWRLQSYSQILDLAYGKSDLEHGKDNPDKKGTRLSMQVEALKELLQEHLPLVVECFAKITDTIAQDTQIYLLSVADKVKPILKAGLNAKNLKVRKNAGRAQENLLRFSSSDYLDVE